MFARKTNFKHLKFYYITIKRKILNEKNIFLFIFIIKLLNLYEKMRKKMNKKRFFFSNIIY